MVQSICLHRLSRHKAGITGIPPGGTVFASIKKYAAHFLNVAKAPLNQKMHLTR